jgi:hypothetical protein
MVRNILILCGPDGAAGPAARLAARLAAEAGDDIGRVHTALAPSAIKASGCRVEEERDFGGVRMGTLDEPLEVGAAIAQLVGHADAVVLDRLDDWAGRLLGHHDDEADIASELTSVESVMNARLADLVLLVTPPGDEQGGVADLTRSMLGKYEPLCQAVVDATGVLPVLVRGSLPGLDGPADAPATRSGLPQRP